MSAASGLRSARSAHLAHLAQAALPALVFAAALLAWEATVRLAQVPPYILPAPSRIALTLWQNFGSLRRPGGSR
jgi:ABC-type nitrate/sulfonate/bicarbonate transport system permease component